MSRSAAKQFLKQVRGRLRLPRFAATDARLFADPPLAVLDRLGLTGDRAAVLFRVEQRAIAEQWRNALSCGFLQVDLVPLDRVGSLSRSHCQAYDLCFVVPETILVTWPGWVSALRSALTANGIVYTLIDFNALAYDFAAGRAGDAAYTGLVTLLFNYAWSWPHRFEELVMKLGSHPVSHRLSVNGSCLGPQHGTLSKQAFDEADIRDVIISLAIDQNGEHAADQDEPSSLHSAIASGLRDLPRLSTQAIDMAWLDAVRSAGLEEVGRADAGTLFLTTPALASMSTIPRPRLSFLTEVVLSNANGCQKGEAKTRARAEDSFDAAFTFFVARNPPENVLTEERGHAVIELYRDAFPATTLIANTRTTGQLCDALGQRIERLVQEKRNETSWTNLIDFVAQGNSDDFAMMRRVHEWAQQVVFHHPVVQLSCEDGDILRDPLAIAWAGIGRCGHVAQLLLSALQTLGYNARIKQLAYHICTEVELKGQWYLLDADILKGGVMPEAPDGEWLKINDLVRFPRLIDYLPSIGLALSPSGRWARAPSGRSVRGYVDLGYPWDKLQNSYLYFGGKPMRLPAPPELRFDRKNAEVRVSLSGVEQGVESIRLLFGTRSRGWTYDDIPGASYRRQPAGDLGNIEVDPWHLQKGMKLHIEYDGVIYVSAYSLDSRMLADPQIYRWPGEEVVLGIPN